MRSSFPKLLTVAALIAAFSFGPAAVLAADKEKQAEEKPKKPKPYPLNVCAVSGEKFGGDMGKPHVFAVEGREVKLCCKSCLKDFEENKVAILKKIDEAAKKVKPYPLKVCAVSGEAFGGDMGEPFVFIHDLQEVKLCCESCKDDFDKNPAKVMAKLKK